MYVCMYYSYILRESAAGEDNDEAHFPHSLALTQHTRTHITPRIYVHNNSVYKYSV